MKKLLLALALVSGSISAAPWEDPYLDRVRDLDNATLEKLVAERDMPATIQLARNLWEERNAEGNAARAFALMRIAAGAKVPSAEYNLGGWLWVCFTAECDKPAALSLLERAAQAGHPIAHEFLGSIYGKDSEYVKKDAAKSYAHYLAAAEQGLVSAQADVAIKLCAGDGVKKDRKGGRKWADLSQKDQRVKFTYKDFGC